MEKKKWIVGIGVLLLVGIGIWWWQSSASDPAQEEISETLTPEISVSSATITDINDDRINIMTEVVLKNPFPVEFSSSSMAYEVYVDSIKVIEDDYNEPVKISSSDSTAIEVPMVVLADPMGRILDHFSQEGVDSAHYALNATVVLDVPIEGKEEFTMKIADTLPTFQMMSVKLQDFSTNTFSSDEGVDVVMRVTNPNHYPVRYLNSSFTFTIKDEMEVVGNMEDVINIPAGGTEDISIHAKKEWGSLTQSGLDFLFNQEDTEFTYHFNAVMSSDNEMLDGTQVETTVKGTLNELSGAMGL